MGCGWNDCGCSTLYTDAWGNAINGGGGANTSPCTPNWGLIALGAFAAVVAMTMHKGKK